MKVGIITYWESQNNYGQILQGYALQRAIEELGGDPFLIKYDSIPKQNLKKRITHYFFLLFSYKELCKAFQRKKGKSSKGNGDVVDREFEIFKKKYIKSTDKIYSIDDLYKNPPLADFYVCGSDQVWNSYNEGYLLQWGVPEIPRISYAASFGSPEISREYQFYLKKALKQFKKVTVREKSGIDICEKAGHTDVQKVPDPTMLLDQRHYMSLFQQFEKRKRKYILLYLLGNESSIDVDHIKEFANKKDLEIVYIPSMDRQDDLPRTFPTIEEWLFLFSDADYVLTNSYHGMIFSIIFNRNFGVYNLSGKYSKMNVRIDSLLSELKLKHRIVSNDLSVLEEDIFYEEINVYLKNQSCDIRNEMKTWFDL